jgi:glycosyltransferase involved in cell wall biosynthesis
MIYISPMSYNKSKVTIVIPARNEAEGLERILKSIKKYANEVIVVDGHSNDGSKKIALENKAKFILDHGLGRGDAVKIGLKKASNEIIVLFDADGSHKASDIPKLVLPILADKADIVIGSRRTGGSFDLNMSFSGILRSGGADFLTYMVNKKFETGLSDILYSFRAVRKSSVKDLNLEANDFCIEQEMVVKALKNSVRLIEVPSRESARGWGKSKLKTITGVKFIFNLLYHLYM